MSELYGAPSGILAAQANERAGLASGLNAFKLLGEIEKQPAEKRLAEAHARLYEGQASLAESQARDLAQMQALERDVAQARSQGVDLTVEDAARRSAQSKLSSLSEPIEQLVAEGQRRGTPLRLMLPAIKEIVYLRGKEATMLSQEATRLEHLANVAKKDADRKGALATLGLKGPQSYAQMRAMAAEEGLPINGLPESFEQAVPILQGIVASSLSVKEQADLTVKDAQLKATKARDVVTERKANAYIAAAIARKDLVVEKLNKLKKNDGGASPEVVELRRERTEASRAVREARERKEFPPAPLDPKARTPEQSYTAADGKTRFKWTKDPTSGEYRAMILPSKGSGKAGSAGAGSADPDDDDED